MLVVGDEGSLQQLIRTLDSQPAAGYEIVAAACSQLAGSSDPHIAGVPVVGSELDAAELAEEVQADIVACAQSAKLGSRALQRLTWRLEGSDKEVIVVPDVIDVAGPRITTRPINGIPLLLIEQPRFDGKNLAIKTLMDKVLSLAGLLVTAPLLVAIAVSIRLDDHGPVIFRQERVGMNGRNFQMWKFRSMRVGADKEHAQMMAAHGTQDVDRGPMFKLQNDPRVTRVGALLRRTSLDELPQLWNILRGDMSLVGPRPPLPSEAETYDSAAMRRLLVKPGLTGMWQVSGRSNLSWEESVRLDLYYVANWTLMDDLAILFRTVKTVLTREGAY